MISLPEDMNKPLRNRNSSIKEPITKMGVAPAFEHWYEFGLIWIDLIWPKSIYNSHYGNGVPTMFTS